MEWLFDGRMTILVLLAVLVVVLLVLYWQSRQKGMLYAVVGAGVLLGGYLLLDLLVETDREADRSQIQQRLESMTEAVAAQNADKLFEHVSEQFISPRGNSRKATLALAHSVFGSGRVTGLKIWEIEFPEDFSREKGTGTVTFLFKLEGNFGRASEFFFRCESTWEYTSDRGWLLTKCRILDPTKNNEEAPAAF